MCYLGTEVSPKVFNGLSTFIYPFEGLLPPLGNAELKATRNTALESRRRRNTKQSVMNDYDFFVGLP